VAGLHDRYPEPFAGKASVKPLGERAGLKADMLDLPALVPNEPRDGGGFAIGLPFLDEHPAFVNHTDARTVQRYVDPDKELHGDILQEGLRTFIVGSHGGARKALARSAHLYRQAEIFARERVELETSPLSGWVGATAAALQPLIDVLAAELMASDTLYVDDTPVPVLAPGAGKTKTGLLWVYVRDARPFDGKRPPAALFFYSPDRKGEHPRAHPTDFRGVIHADGYAGFKDLFAGNRIAEAACWVHVRRKFFDVHAATGSPIAKELRDRIGQLYRVEGTIDGALPDDRRRERQQRSKRDRQAQRHQSAASSRRRPRSYRRPPGTAYRRTAPVELAADRDPARRRVTPRLLRALTSQPSLLHDLGCNVVIAGHSYANAHPDEILAFVAGVISADRP
jgi:hypothetical protein